MSDKKFLLISGGKKELTTPPNNQIYYRTTTGEKQDPYNIYHADGTTPIFVGTDGSQANLVSNEYKNGYGVMTFDKELGNINNDMEGDIVCFFDINTETENINSTFIELNLPSSITEYYVIFSYCINLEKCKIPNGVTIIGDWAFNDCNGLTSITIPNSVTSIGEWAFYACTGMKSIEIPNSVTSIGNDAFSYCISLISIKIEAETPPTVGNSNFKYCSKLTSIQVPSASVNAYKTANGWKDYADNIVAIPE